MNKIIDSIVGIVVFILGGFLFMAIGWFIRSLRDVDSNKNIAEEVEDGAVREFTV